MDEKVGRFQILREIGKGGAGKVYCALDPTLNREVALKFLLSGEFADEVELGRFQREVSICSKLRHPNIVSLYEVGKEPGKGIFMVMEFVEGVSLDIYIKQNKISPHRAAELVCSLAKAMEYAHREGIIHRDIKPQNILVRRDGFPMLTDFGLARHRDLEAKDRFTKPGDFVGTPAYMPPEQINGDHPSVQMDVYGLGAVFYEILCGCPPYQGDPIQVLYHILNEFVPSPSPRNIKKNLAKDLDTICQKAMHKNPRKRYSTALELAQDLELYLAGKPIKARPMTFWEKSYFWCRQHKLICLSILLSLASMIFGIIMLDFLQKQRELSESNFYIQQGDRFLKKAMVEEDWISNVRMARIQYETALGFNFKNQKARRSLYECELFYARKSLQEGLLERAEDAISAAEALNIPTEDLNHLKRQVEREKKLVQIFSGLSEKKALENEQEILAVANRNPSQALRFIISNLIMPESQVSAKKLLAKIPFPESKKACDWFCLENLTEKEARALGEIIQEIYPLAMERLLPCLKRANEKVCKNILIMIESSRYKKAEDFLIEMAFYPEKNPCWKELSIQLQLCHTLGALEIPSTLSALLRILSTSTNIKISMAAMEAISGLGTEAQIAIPVLVQRQSDYYPASLRFQSVKCLMRISIEHGVFHAVNLLQDGKVSLEIKARLWHFLACQSQETLVEFLDRGVEYRRWKKTGLSLESLPMATSSILMEKLEKILDPDTSPKIQKKAIALIREMNHPRKIEILLTAFRSPHISVQREAAFALSLLPVKPDKKSAISAITMKTQDSYTRMYLLLTLGKMGDMEEELTDYIKKNFKEGDLVTKISCISLEKETSKKIEDALSMLDEKSQSKKKQ